MAQGSRRPEGAKKTRSLVNGSLVVHGKVFSRRIRIFACVRITNRAGERSRPRRITIARKRLRDRSGKRGRLAGLKTVSHLHAKPDTASFGAIDIRGGVTAYSFLGTTYVGLEGRRWRRKNRVRALTVITTQHVTHPLAEGL